MTTTMIQWQRRMSLHSIYLKRLNVEASMVDVKVSIGPRLTLTLFGSQSRWYQYLCSVLACREYSFPPCMQMNTVMG
jgi:hypothetical protein